MSLLIVEDNPVNAKILTIHLQKAGYEAIVAHSAKEALECLNSNPRIRKDALAGQMEKAKISSKAKPGKKGVKKSGKAIKKR